MINLDCGLVQENQYNQAVLWLFQNYLSSALCALCTRAASIQVFDMHC